MAEATYKEILGQLTADENRELLHRKLDCVMQALDNFYNEWSQHEQPNNVQAKLQVPDYPQPNVVIYTVPSATGHPPFYADSEYIAENWPWPDVPPPPAPEGIAGAPVAQVSLPDADTKDLPGDGGVG